MTLTLVSSSDYRFLVSDWCPSEAKVTQSSSNSVTVGHSKLFNDADRMKSVSL